MLASEFSGQRFNLVCDGNSICEGNVGSLNGWASRLSDLITGLNLKAQFRFSHIGVAGQTTADMITRQASFLYPLYSNAGVKDVVIAMEGRNDLFNGATVQQAYDNIVTYCQNARNNGFQVIWINHSPSTGGTPVGRTQAQLETARLQLRSMILSDFSVSTPASLVYRSNSVTYANLVCDLGGDSTYGSTTNYCANASLCTDGTHPTAAGALGMANIDFVAIQYLLSNM